MRNCPSGDFYMLGPNGLPVKKHETSQEWQKPRDGPTADQPLNKVRIVPGVPGVTPNRSIRCLSGA